jgi:four helix bundle protein
VARDPRKTGLGYHVLKSFRELEVWQKAHALTLDVYSATSQFPRAEQFGVVAQIRRAVMSIPANIAEGFGRHTTKDFLHFLTIANGSLEETRYFLILSSGLRYLEDDRLKQLESRCDSVGQMLGALSRSLRERNSGFSRATGRGARAAN